VDPLPSLVGYSLFVNELAYPILPPAPQVHIQRTIKHDVSKLVLLYLLHASNSIGNNKQNNFVILLRFVCFVDPTLGVGLRALLTLPLGKETMEQCKVDLRNVHKVLV
jgi:hypothetical protein